MLPRYQMTYAIHRRQRKWVRLSGYKVDRQARGTKRAFMTEITHFVALAFDLVDGGLVAGEAVDCASPAVAIQTAQGQWKILGHAGAVAFSRTSDFERPNSTTGTCCAGLDRCRTSTQKKTMTHECRIAVVIFGCRYRRRRRRIVRPAKRRSGNELRTWTVQEAESQSARRSGRPLASKN